MRISEWLLCLFLISSFLPVMADPQLSEKKALSAAKRLDRVYYASWKAAEADISEMAYCFEGMLLAGTGTDFMKDVHPMVIHHSTRVQNGNALVKDEVLAPVWSNTNHGHVIRNRVLNYTRKIQNGKYLGIDNRLHSVGIKKKSKIQH